MSGLTDDDLYRRGTETLLASWAAFARGAPAASLSRSVGVAAAIFPLEPERTYFNNAVLDRNLTPGDRAGALDAMEAWYAAAGIARFAAWVHETDSAMRDDLERREYVVAESTRAMGLELEAIRVPRPEIDLGPHDWDAYLRILEVPAGLHAGVDRGLFPILIGRLAGRNVAAAMAFDRSDDCGIFNVTTLEQARRRGLGSALTTLHAYAARDRGCRTATLQATPMAERIYEAIGFRDLGRILEYVPAPS